jgi:hypothetical protein
VTSTEADRYIVHFVLLDDDFPSAFCSTNRDKAEAAVQILAAAFGHDRVSRASFGEKDLEEYRAIVAEWTADPRMRSPRR